MNAANPDDAPKSQVEVSAERRYYSPWQICVAALLGGPLAGGYFASRDHQLFGSPTKAKRTLIVAAVVLAGAIWAGYVLPEHASRAIPAAIIAAIYRQYAEAAFSEAISQRKEQGWVRDSWWRVVGVSLAFLVLSVGLNILVLLVFPPQGN